MCVCVDVCVSCFLFCLRDSMNSTSQKVENIGDYADHRGTSCIVWDNFFIKLFVWTRYDIVACNFEMVLVQFIESNRNELKDQPTNILTEMRSTNFQEVWRFRYWKSITVHCCSIYVSYIYVCVKSITC